MLFLALFGNGMGLGNDTHGVWLTDVTHSVEGGWVCAAGICLDCPLPADGIIGLPLGGRICLALA